MGLAEALDDEVLAFAINNERVLLTFDADFGDIRLFPIGTHAGIIRLRMADQVAEILHPVLEHALASLADRDLSGKLVTVARTTIRIRGQA